jgi:hypothetical protein
MNPRGRTLSINSDNAGLFVIQSEDGDHKRRHRQSYVASQVCTLCRSSRVATATSLSPSFRSRNQRSHSSRWSPPPESATSRVSGVANSPSTKASEVTVTSPTGELKVGEQASDKGTLTFYHLNYGSLFAPAGFEPAHSGSKAK